MDFTFEQINAFYAVATTGSFSNAAEKIFRTQSAVSIQVARLEETIGRRLIHRTTKSIELTEAGKVFLGYVEKIRGLLAEAQQELLDLEKMERGRLTISTSDTTACYLLPGILQTYKDHYPGIEIVVRNSTSLQTIEKVMQNEVDIGIATLAYLKPGLEAIPLFPRFDVVICHPDHPLANRKQVLLKEVEKHLCVLLDDHCSSRRILDQACLTAGVKLSIAMELSSIEVIKNLVMIKSGISIVPQVSVRKEVLSGQLSMVKVRDFQPNRQYKIGAIYKKNRYLSLAAQSFLKELRNIPA
ncbi:MAG: LysR family transcriptional regulator [Deltaproteobacteria bacterium]|nr:LysR family transcriptional regulator [Deltaproteobacteria bacterium]